MNTPYTEDQLRSPLEATHDYVVLRMLPNKESQIALPQGSTARHNAVVVSVGPGRVTDQVGPDGQLLVNKPKVKVGDIVLPNPNAMQPFDLFGHPFCVINHFQILAVVDKVNEKWFEDNPITSNITVSNAGLQALLERNKKNRKN